MSATVDLFDATATLIEEKLFSDKEINADSLSELLASHDYPSIYIDQIILSLPFPNEYPYLRVEQIIASLRESAMVRSSMVGGNRSSSATDGAWFPANSHGQDEDFNNSKGKQVERATAATHGDYKSDDIQSHSSHSGIVLANPEAATLLSQSMVTEKPGLVNSLRAAFSSGSVNPVSGNPWKRTMSRLSMDVLGNEDALSNLPIIEPSWIKLTIFESPPGPFTPVTYKVAMEGGFHLGKKIPSAVVIRRFSDFVWLRQAYLIKRFPFRLVPPIPPKRVYASGDVLFMEERRAGLARFLAILLHHPVMSFDPIVMAFMTQPIPWIDWKCQNPIIIEEEYYLLPKKPEPLSITEDESPSTLWTVTSAIKFLPQNFEQENEEFLQDAYLGACYYTEKLEAILKTLKEFIYMQKQVCLNSDKLEGNLREIANVELEEGKLASICRDCGNLGDTATRMIQTLQNVSTSRLDQIKDLEWGVMNRFRLLIDLFQGAIELLRRVKKSQYDRYEKLGKEIISLQAQLEKFRLRDGIGIRSVDQAKACEQLKKTHGEYVFHHQRDEFGRKCTIYDLAWLHCQQHALVLTIHQLAQWNESFHQILGTAWSSLLQNI